VFPFFTLKKRDLIYTDALEDWSVAVRRSIGGFIGTQNALIF